MDYIWVDFLTDGWLLSAVPTLTPPDNANNAHATYYNQRQQHKTHTQEHFMHRAKNAFFTAPTSILLLYLFFASMFTRRFCNKFGTAAEKKWATSCSARHRAFHVSHFSCATRILTGRALRDPIGHENTLFPAPRRTLQFRLFALRLQ
jgi:hypothetical protein